MGRVSCYCQWVAETTKEISAPTWNQPYSITNTETGNGKFGGAEFKGTSLNSQSTQGLDQFRASCLWWR